MVCRVAMAVFALGVGWLPAQTPTSAARPKFDAFEVATIKTTDEKQQGRFIRMESDNRLVERGYTVKLLIAAAYDLNPKTISGGPAWMNDDHYDIEARTPGAVRPTHDEQMAMLRSLLGERFGLKFHREQKEYSIYALEIAKGGPKLKATATPDAPATVGPGVMYEQHLALPARNATVAELASLLQRAILDRPVVDETGLKERYDFDLDWAPNDSELGGAAPKMPADSPAPPLFEALQKQLGLKLEATRGMVAAMVVDGVERPTAN